MPHTDNSKSQETNRLSCHTSTDTSKLQAIVYLAMPHTDTNKSQATNHTSCQYLTQIPADHGGKKSFISHDTSKSQATSRASYHVSHIYQQITGSKSYILLTIPPADTSTSWATKRTPYHASQRYRQYIVHLAMRDTYHRDLLLFLNRTRSSNQLLFKIVFVVAFAGSFCDQITGNEPYSLSCITQTLTNQRQQFAHLATPRTDTNKSQATNRTSRHASHRYQLITGNKTG